MKLIKYLLLISLGILFGCSSSGLSDMCGNKILKEITSPDKKLKAVIFTRDCGATTDFSSQLSIIDYSDNLENETGNILIISDKEYKPETGVANVNAEWNGNNELIIYFDTKVESFLKMTEMGSVKIIYRQLDE